MNMFSDFLLEKKNWKRKLKMKEENLLCYRTRPYLFFGPFSLKRKCSFTTDNFHISFLSSVMKTGSWLGVEMENRLGQLLYSTTFHFLFFSFFFWRKNIFYFLNQATTVKDIIKLPPHPS